MHSKFGDFISLLCVLLWDHSTMAARLIVAISATICIQTCFGASVLHIRDNGYENVLVGISPDVPEDPQIIDSIKELFVNSSAFLHRAMRGRAYFKDVKILIPKTWTQSKHDVETDDVYEDSHIRIDVPNELHGDIPYAKQTRGCGEPGDFIHLTPSFLLELKDKTWENFGDPAKVLVHEWAHLRYGVFDEHGYPEDEHYPFFYRSSSGKILPTSCANKPVDGYRWDKNTYGTCNIDRETGLPDKNCYFSPFEESDAHSSIMSFSFLETVDTFCDDTRENRHNAEAPTKQNVLCNYRSTWDVITSNPDFRNNRNPPANISNTAPTFTVIRKENPRFVLVADISSSMQGDRIERLAHTSRNWIKYDLPDDTLLGIVQFGTSAQIVAGMTRVTASSRPRLINLVPSTVSGSTCIGCGMEMARSLLKKGGTILLITDGGENESPRIADVVDNLVRADIRVITLAFTDAADSKIEDLAERTKGLSFFVKNYQDFSQAFKASTTSQSGVSVGERDVILYDEQITKSTVFDDQFVVDGSTGKDFVFQVDFRRKEFVTHFALISPSGMRFTPSNANYDSLGAYRIMQSQAEVGQWNFTIILSSAQSNDFARISVKAKPRNSTFISQLIHTKCSISTGSSPVNPQETKVSIVAEVQQGSSPVLGADVRAKVSRPDKPPVFLDLYDTGVGADITANDGVYTRYFTDYTRKGRYSVQCLVSNTGRARVRKGFLASTVFPRKPALLENVCCGNQEVLDSIPIEAFTRQSTAGSFQVSVDIPPDVDFFPPGRVTDLTVSVVHVENRTVAISLNNLDSSISSMYTFKMTWTSPGDDLDQGTVYRYVVKVSKHLEALKYDHENITIVTEDDLLEGSLTPSEAGDVHSIVLNRTSMEFETDVTYFFGLVSFDDGDLFSDLSNTPFAYFPSQIEPEPAPEPEQHYVLVWISQNTILFGIYVTTLILATIVITLAIIMYRRRSHTGRMVMYKKHQDTIKM